MHKIGDGEMLIIIGRCEICFRRWTYQSGYRRGGWELDRVGYNSEKK